MKRNPTESGVHSEGPSRRHVLGIALGATAGVLGKMSSLPDSALAAPPKGGPDDQKGPVLLAHWPLHGDARDISGNGHHGQNQGADLAAEGPRGELKTAAGFDGRGAHIEIRGSELLRLGRDDFTIAVWVHTESVLDDVLGDILCHFDSERRIGLTLGFSHGTVTSSQANYRQLQFGIDAGAEGAWTDRGRPGRSVYTHTLAVFDGDLYAGTCEPEKDQSGHVYRYAGGTKWVDCGSPDPCNAVAALAVHDGQLYAGVSRYRLAGSSLPESPNRRFGGKVYRYAGGSKWVDCGKVGDAEALGGLAVFRGQLYASSTYSPGVYRYEGGTTWTYCGSGPENKRIVALGVFNGHLFGTSYDGGRVYRYEGGQAWSLAGEIPGATQTYGFAAYQGRWLVSTWPKGEVYQYEGENRWTSLGRLGEELEVMPLAVYNGKLYGGTLPLAQVYRHDGRNTWTPTGRVDMTPDVRYRRAWSMTVHKGQLFCGTLPSGHVHSYQAGPCVTHDHALAPGWNHLAAVRRGEVLELFVNGKKAAVSERFDPNRFDTTHAGPWLIGTGPQDSLLGRLSDLRVYRGALKESDIQPLARRA